MLRIWLQFALCTAAIGVAGYHLSRYGNVIAERTGLGRTLIGVVMVATVTSLSALAVSVSALRLGALDLAIDNLLSSNLFGMGVSAMVMSGAVIAVLCCRPAGREFRAFGSTGLFLLAVFTINAHALCPAGEQ